MPDSLGSQKSVNRSAFLGITVKWHGVTIFAIAHIAKGSGKKDPRNAARNNIVGIGEYFSGVPEC